jgi:Nickel responsive protein SCO4226-like
VLTTEEADMRLYVIRRPDGWGTAQELAAAAARSKRVGDEEMSADVRWIRSYVVREASGALGTFCIYEASSIEKIREHAQRAGIPATDIFEVADTVVIRPDPVALAV